MQPSITVDQFAALVGEHASLYSCGTDTSVFQLGSVVFEPEADESDDLRSELSHIGIRTVEVNTANKLDDVLIRISEDGDIQGWDIVSLLDKHVWVTFGTDMSDSLYPSFIMKWNPRPPIEEDLKKLIK